MFVTPGVVVDGKLVTKRSGQDQPAVSGSSWGDPNHDDWEAPGDVRGARIHWVIRLTGVIRGTKHTNRVHKNRDFDGK